MYMDKLREVLGHMNSSSAWMSEKNIPVLLRMDLFPLKSERKLFSACLVLAVFLGCHF